MTWTKPDPFGTGLGVAASVLQGQQAGKQAAADAARQAEQDRLAAITGALKNTQTIADTDEARARTTGLVNTGIHQHAEDVSHGYILPPGALPPEMPSQAPGKPPPSNRAFADYYSKLGAFYTRNKALDAASTAVGLADKYGGMATAEEKQALAVKAQAEKAFQDLATQRHWSADLKQKMKEELGRMVRESMRNGTSLEVATLNGVNAMARTVYTQGHEDARAVSAHAAAAALHAGGGKKTTAGERDTAGFNAASGSLTPQGKSFMSMLYNTNNQPTKAQALQALDVSKLSPGDKANARTIIESKQSQFVTPGSQVTGARADANAGTKAENTAYSRSDKSFEAIAKGESYTALPGRLKAAIRHIMVDQRQSVDDALGTLDSAPDDVLSSTEKQQIRSVLGTLPK